MRLKLLVFPVFLIAAAPAPASADDCLAEIKALYGDEMNAYTRKPYRSTKTVYDADGRQTHVFENLVETPLRTISGVKGSGAYTLVVDLSAWTGPGADGPWTPAPANFPKDRKAGHDAFREAEIAGMSDPECPGAVDLDGRPALKFVFRIKTEPVAEMNGMWLADHNTVWLDPASKDVLRWDKTDFQSNWAPDVSKERHVEVFEYDGSIKVTSPD